MNRHSIMAGIALLFVWVNLLDAAEKRTGFAIEPYLVEVTESSAVVAFRLHNPMTAQVTLFDGNVRKVFKNEMASTTHFIAVTQLEPSRTYRYEVTLPGTDIRTPPGDPSYQIRTAVRKGETFNFVVYGDTRPGGNGTHRYHQAVVRQILSYDPSFALILGDMVDNGADPGLWRKFFDIESGLLRRSSVFPVIGDNDMKAGRGLVKSYFPMLREEYYHFQWGGIHFFGMNSWGSTGGQPKEELDQHSKQLDWLIANLEKPEVQAAPFRILFVHDPIHISRGRSSDLLKKVWAPVLEKFNVDMVLASWHMYERSIKNGINYFISGGGGAELIWMDKNPNFTAQMDALQHHFLNIEVNSTSITVNAVSQDGTFLDSVVLFPRSKHVAPTGHTAAKPVKPTRIIDIPADSRIEPLCVSLFSHNCTYCQRLLNHKLPQLAMKAGVPLRVHYFDFTSHEKIYDLFLSNGAAIGRQDSQIPAIFIGSTVLGGKHEIENRLPEELDKYRQNPAAYPKRSGRYAKGDYDTTRMRENEFEALTLGIVFGAGLLDGINPCAFTTLIFLISYLSYAGHSRREMVMTGSAYSLAIFLTYFIIGVCFFQLADWMQNIKPLSFFVNGLLGTVVAVLAIISFMDFLRCMKGKSTQMTLQLPGFLKKGIHGRIRIFARQKSVLFASAFVLGVIIAGMELACTGQVYLPIVTMISEPRYRLDAFFYLIFYNLMFITPVLVVFILSVLGISSKSIERYFRRRVGFVKLGLSVVFVFMSGIMFYNLNLG